jgi:predicted dehydrogenase
MAKYRAGVIGCTGIGTAHASGLVGLDNAELVAACDLSEEKLEEFSRRWKETWPGIATYTDHRQMLASQDLDIVTVATSDHAHADLVVDSAESGAKGIFCEKPLATNLADADRMVAACESNGTLLSVDHTRRFQPLWRHIKELVDQGTIGPVQNIIATLYGSRAMLFRNGTHIIDLLCFFAESEPRWVFAELEDGYEGYAEYRGDGGHEPGTEPGAHGYIHFANGVRGLYIGGPKTTPLPKMSCRIVGTSGYIDADGFPSGTRATITTGEETEPISAEDDGAQGIALGVQELVTRMENGGELASPGRVGRTVVEIIIGFLESQRRGNVRVPLPLPR